MGTRLRIRVAPHLNVGPYVRGGYVPDGYEATVTAVEATYSTSASDSSG